MKRRAFIKMGLLALPLATSVRTHALGTASDTAPPCRVLVDSHCPDREGFAASAVRLGVDVQTVPDVIRFWYDKLQGLQARRLPIGGLTDPSSLFYLDELVRGSDWVVAWRAEHRFSRDLPVTHHVTGSRDALTEVRMLHEAGEVWAATAARLVVGHAGNPSSWHAPRECRFATPAIRSLVSWVIAPRSFQFVPPLSIT
jgi:hypothetical protein